MLKMSGLNEELVLEYLVENVSKDLVRQYPIKSVLAMDYCYKRGENIPNDYLSDIVSKIINNRVNPSSKPLNINELNLIDCLFIKPYEALLSNQVKGLVKNAKTTKDFKKIAIIDLLSQKVSNSQRILSSNGSLDSKILGLAKAYNDSAPKNNFTKDYNRLREMSLKVNAELNQPLDTELAKYLQNVRKNLDAKQAFYSNHKIETSAHEIQNLIVSMKNSIDHKLNDYLCNVNQHYEQVKNSFENGIWDNERRINRLIGLRSDLESVKHNYQMALYKKGIDRCEELEDKMRGVINRHHNLKYTLEEFKSVKTELSDYYPELKRIFSKDTSLSSVNRINEIYSRLNGLVSKKFPNYIPGEQKVDYYSGLNKIKMYIQQECNKKAIHVLDKCTKYREKADGSFFSWRTKKFVEDLKKYDPELEAWSKCQASSNLRAVIEKNLEANNNSFRRAGLKCGNQETSESKLKKRIKTGLVCAAVISALGLGFYGFNYCWHKRGSYVAEQEKKIVYYQKQFDDIKYYYNHGDYFKADDLSEKLQDEMGKESYFSPTKDLYKEVKRYDNEVIDPEVKRINRENFYREVKAIPGRLKNKISEKWGSIPSGGKFMVYAGSAGILWYLLRRRCHEG